MEFRDKKRLPVVFVDTYANNGLGIRSKEVWDGPEGPQKSLDAFAVALHVVSKTCGRTADQRRTTNMAEHHVNATR